jgi:arginine decarboxylase
MDKFNIQINKTSRNTVLLMTNIGTTRSSITYLTNALLKIADELDKELLSLTLAESKMHQDRIHSLTQDCPPLPDFSYFHNSFQAVPGVPGGNIRSAFTLAYNEENYEYIQLDECLPSMQKGRVLVASCFIIPYPPGFPVLVPGQVVSEEIIHFLMVLDVSEIHGYRPEHGLRIFKEKVLNRQKTVTSIGGKIKK